MTDTLKIGRNDQPTKSHPLNLDETTQDKKQVYNDPHSAETHYLIPHKILSTKLFPSPTEPVIVSDNFCLFLVDL